jgi:hypothetical protein
MNISDTTSIILSICAIIGIIISYKMLKHDLNKQVEITDSMIASIKQSQGGVYNNCNFNYSGDVKDENTIKNEYKKL